MLPPMLYVFLCGEVRNIWRHVTVMAFSKFEQSRSKPMKLVSVIKLVPVTFTVIPLTCFKAPEEFDNSISRFAIEHMFRHVTKGWY